MTATLKAYVDMGDISEKNIKRSGKKITITLPDPQFALTSTKVANEETRQYVALTRSNFSDEELADYTRQGRQSIIGSIPKMGIIENARASAARTIIPIIKATGYSEDNITVTFRKSFTDKELEALFNYKIEQYGNDNKPHSRILAHTDYHDGGHDVQRCHIGGIVYWRDMVSQQGQQHQYRG